MELQWIEMQLLCIRDASGVNLEWIWDGSRMQWNGFGTDKKYAWTGFGMIWKG